MPGLLAPTFIALCAAVAFRGSLRRVFASGIYGWPFIVGAFALELALYNPPIDAQPWAMLIGPWLWLGSRFVLLAVLIVNGWVVRDGLRWPWRIAAIGLALNTLAIALNQGHMPQSPAAAIAVWGASHIDATRLQNVSPMGPDTLLPWLGDVLAEPSWLPRRNVVSIGDVLLALGIATWIFRTATLPPRPVEAKIGSRIATSLDGAARPQRSASS